MEDFIDFMEDMVEDKDAPSLHNEEFWKNIPQSGLLYKLTNNSWNDFVRSHNKVLVTIYSEDCPNCKNVRSPLAKCAKKLFQEKMNVQLAVIDGDKYSSDISRLWTIDMGVPTMFWFENGIKKFEYMKARVASEIFHFIKNPVKTEVKKSFPDWSMQESAEYIYHYKDSGFDEFAKDQEEMMVFFYSPTCSTCYKLRSVYEEAAERLDDEKPSVSMTAVNLNEALVVKDKYSINSYPHFAYFKKGKYLHQYHGKQDVESLVAFMKKPKFTEKPKSENTWSERETNVTVLTEENFHDFVTTHDHVMVIFYTKWCGHCKHFKPKYEKAANALKDKNSSAQLTAIDGNEAKGLLKEYKVYGFPTMLYFKNGQFSKAYTGKRDASAVVDFMLENSNAQPTSEAPDEEEDKLLTTKPMQVKYLAPYNITEFLEEHDECLVMFYAPFCGACKTAKNGFFQAAVVTAEEDQDTGFGIINALKHKNDVKDYDISGYPTFWYFREGRKKFKYEGERSKSAFLKFLNDPQPGKKQELSSNSIVQWISETGNVEHPNQENFDDFLQKYEHIMVFFYVSGCEMCLKNVKPEYVKAADILYKELPSSVKLAAVNGAWEKKLMKRYEVNSFPSFLYFNKGEMKYRYHGLWRSKNLVDFMTNPREDLAKKIKPTSWQDMTPLQYGRVTHLGNKTYDDFISNHRYAVVMFHSLYYDRCKPAREQLKSAADKLSDQNDVGLGAVDCHRQPEQGLVCYHLGIKIFPSFKYYEDGIFQSDLPVENPDDITMFLKGRLLLKEEESQEKNNNLNKSLDKEEL